MTLFRVAILLAAVTLGGCGSLSLTSSIPGTPETSTSLNGFRASNGLGQLAVDANLTALASAHSGDMARRDSLDHDGFMTQRGPKGARAENVAYGCKDSPCVIQQWVNSSGHRKNMLIPAVTKYGLASATSASGKKYWTLELGE